MQPLLLIKQGSTGTAVKVWQQFLLHQGFSIVGSADGVFGAHTDTATRAFQTKAGLQPDGVVGNNTYAAAMKLGFNAVLAIADFIGIDVSHYDSNNGQNPIQWNLVKADPQNISFAYIKATDGATGSHSVDPTFAANIKEATAEGLLTGAYHFYEPTSSPQAQADNFIQAVGKTYPYKLPPMLDFEQNIAQAQVQQTIANIQAWLTAVENAWGIKPVIYTAPTYWYGLGNPTSFTNYLLWIADYNPGLPPMPGDWNEWAIWQYTGNGKVNGIATEVDLNKYNLASGLIA